VKIRQKVLTYTPVQKLEMFLVAVLAGAKAVSHTATTIHLDPALISAFGLPECADQSGIAQTLNAATEQDVADLQATLGELFGSSSQACRHDFTHQSLVLDIDLSPLPASSASEGSERGYMGRCRSKTGRKLVRVRAATSQEIVWKTVMTGRMVESLPILQEAIYAMKSRLGLGGEDTDTLKKRERTELRLDSGWGSEPIITWLLERGYQVTGLLDYGIVRLIGQIWAIPRRVKLAEHDGVVRVRLRRQHPRACDVCQGFLPLFPQRQSMVVLG
jgi:hypothetical protein